MEVLCIKPKVKTYCIFILIFIGIELLIILSYAEIITPDRDHKYINNKYQGQKKGASFADIAPYFGKRIAFWGVFTYKDSESLQNILLFGNPNLKIPVSMSFEKAKDFFKEIKLHYNAYGNLTFKEHRRIAYMSGLIIFVGVKGPPDLSSYGYGSFYITNLQVIKFFPGNQKKELERILPYKITVEKLTPKDKKSELFLGDSTPETLKKQIDIYKGI